MQCVFITMLWLINLILFYLFSSRSLFHGKLRSALIANPFSGEMSTVPNLCLPNSSFHSLWDSKWFMDWIFCHLSGGTTCTYNLPHATYLFTPSANHLPACILCRDTPPDDSLKSQGLKKIQDGSGGLTLYQEKNKKHALPVLLSLIPLCSLLVTQPAYV